MDEDQYQTIRIALHIIIAILGAIIGHLFAK